MVRQRCYGLIRAFLLALAQVGLALANSRLLSTRQLLSTSHLSATSQLLSTSPLLQRPNSRLLSTSQRPRHSSSATPITAYRYAYHCLPLRVSLPTVMPITTYRYAYYCLPLRLSLPISRGHGC